MKKKIKYVFFITLRICVFIINLFIRRNDKYITFYAKSNFGKEAFINNTKYLYLYLANNKEKYKLYHVNWLCSDKKFIKFFKANGYNDFNYTKSFKGVYYALKSKWWILDSSADMVKSSLAQGAIFINLGHGVYVKKVAFDDPGTMKYHSDLPKWQQKIHSALRYMSNYHIANSEYEKRYVKSGFHALDDQFIDVGTPRIDVFYDDIKGVLMNSENDYKNIVEIRKKYYSVFYYTPTYRDDGRSVLGWLKSDKLKEFLKKNNAIIVSKLHIVDQSKNNLENSEHFYFMNADTDIYPMMKYSDAMITDYSSIYFDYLHLNKPIIYYSPDLEEYESKRGFYGPYNDITAGDIVKDEDALIHSLQNVIDGVDNYQNKRKALLNEMFLNQQDGHNCERFVDWLEKMSK